MFFKDSRVSVATKDGDFIAWASNMSHQCTQLGVARPGACRDCKVKRVTITCYLRKNTAAVCGECKVAGVNESSWQEAGCE